MNKPMLNIILSDSAFPLQRHIIKRFPLKNMLKKERVFNYRLCGGRLVSENASGILANSFRILLTPINLSQDKVVLITQACCALHNFIKTEASAIVYNEVDKESTDGQLQNGLWRNNVQHLESANFTLGCPNNESLLVREEFKMYFNSHGKV
ncbi:hypothetical protein RN001_005255 [Aquatica leii]|uniref:DDE Tnp4 domain-containing protein n=1 Tax=Aquatica leii TaxID=1421715 RepID=A0AAN7PG30_9COLE|nr:hypothetical protein RN001_005255 [Aquatica leii]